MTWRKQNNSFFKVAIASAFSLALPFCAVFSQFSLPAWATTLADADGLLLQNKLKQAEDAYRELLEEDQTGDAYAGLAVALAKQSWPAKLLEAEKLLRTAKEKFSDNPNVIAAAGYVSYVHSKTVASPAKRDLYLEAAEKLCKKAIKENSNIVIAQQTLGMVKIAQDDMDGAVDPLRKANNLAENSVNLTLLAQVLLHLDPHDKEAEEFVNKALQLKSDYGPAHLQKAVVLTNQGKHEEAFMELHNISDSGRSSDWHLVEGDIYRKQGDGPSALASWAKSNSLDPRNPEPYKRRAEYYTNRGDGELAISEYHNALDILPNDFQMRNQLAELALRQDKLEVAESEFKTILAGKPDDPTAMLGLARCGFRKFRKEGSYPADFTQLMDKLQNIVTEQSVQGAVIKNGTRDLQEKIDLSEAEKALTQNRFREANSKFTGIIEKHREEPFELITLGEQCFQEGDYRAAEKAFTYAKDMNEVSTRAEQGMSRINNQRNEAARQVKLGDATWKIPEVAIDHYKQALSADPQYSNAYYGLFNLFTKSEKQDPGQAINYALCFLEASEDANPLRKEVESNLVKLKKKSGPVKGKEN
ncbi:MAG: Cellulose synthase subunit BcsC [Cyanobacteriota bacterium erpe_2018_sw_21hr_WHONDRS-SW48-000092_B_bin.40]|nr:Cellulose synthase subunit BcsC [Cyanobacteriota bacterium erpe_2018_sw_21hr_WHONDRS-SW48-000092_B_bin.40]